jgi:hypothetical protein
LNYQIQGLSLPADITLDRLQHRRNLLAQFEQQLSATEQNRLLDSYDKFQARAFSLATSQETKQRWTFARSPTRSVIATAATCSGNRFCWRGGWSKPASVMSRFISMPWMVTAGTRTRIAMM